MGVYEFKTDDAFDFARWHGDKIKLKVMRCICISARIAMEDIKMCIRSPLI